MPHDVHRDGEILWDAKARKGEHAVGEKVAVK